MPDHNNLDLPAAIPEGPRIGTGLTRREFVRAGLAVAILAGCAPLRAARRIAAPAAEAALELPTRVLGRTGEPVSILGLGCAYIADKCGEAQTRETIEAALEGGIRLFDTSCDYHLSEERLGPALAPVRDRVFVVTKVNALDRAGVEAELAKSLRRLRTDRVDLLLLHGIGLREKEQTVQAMLGAGGALEALRAAKKDGRARFIGMSVHPANDAGERFLAVSEEWDVVMAFVNYLAPTKWPAAGALIERARGRNLGVIGMKTLSGAGQLADDYDAAFRYVLGVAGVGCALVGVHNADEVRRAVRAARAYRPLTPAEMDALVRRGAEMYRAKTRDVALFDRHAGEDQGAARRA